MQTGVPNGLDGVNKVGVLQRLGVDKSLLTLLDQQLQLLQGLSLVLVELKSLLLLLLPLLLEDGL